MAVTDASGRVSTGADDDKGLGTHLNELLGLVIAYAKQETVVPIKNLGRYVAWGVAGAILLAAGGALATLTGIRVVQAETGPHLHGDWSWVPYGAGLLVALVGVAWAALHIARGDRAVDVKGGRR
jgi:cytochrome c biogenesis protein CcdA